MSSTVGRDTPSWYEIRIEGHLGQRWTAWLDGMTLTTRSDGTTLLRGRVTDQAALHGLLHKLRDTGLPLVSVTRVEDRPSYDAPPAHLHPRPGAPDPHSVSDTSAAGD